VNKTRLVNQIARESKVTASPLTQSQVRQVVEAAFAVLAEVLARPGGRVEIEHFGVLESRLLATRPCGVLRGKDGGRRRLPSQRVVVTFRASKRLRKALRRAVGDAV
jgi:nucleoid DNA-binding protein